MERAASSPPAEPAFHGDDVDQLVSYRTVSPLAIVALLFGLASLLCFASPLFLAIPLIGAALAIVALKRIAASEGMLAGNAVAATGLALCIVCGVAVLSRDAVIRYLRTQQAEENGRHWLALLVSARIQEAFQLTVGGARPAPPPEPGAPPPETSPYDQFASHAVVAAVSAAGADAKIELQRTLSYAAQSRTQFLVRQEFLITPTEAAVSADPSLRPVNAILTMQRSHFPGERQTRWLVRDYELPPSPAHPQTQ